MFPVASIINRTCVSRPKALATCISEESVQHLVVRQQDVRGIRHQLGSVSNEVLLAHLPMRPYGSVVSNPHSTRDSCCADRGVGQECGYPVLLVGHQCVHRIEDERLDPALTAVTRPDGVINGGDEKRFRLAGPGAGRDQCRLWLQTSTGEALPSGELVGVGAEPRRRPGHAEVCVFRCLNEGEPHAKVRPPEDPLALIEQELSKGLVGLVLRESKGRDQVLDNRRLELSGNERRNHDAALTLSTNAR